MSYKRETCLANRINDSASISPEMASVLGLRTVLRWMRETGNSWLPDTL